MKISTRAKKKEKEKRNEKRIWPGRNKTASFWWHKKSFCPLTVNISSGQMRRKESETCLEQEKTSKKKNEK